MLRGRAQYIDGEIEFRDGAGGFDIGVLWGIDFELKSVALPAIPDGPTNRDRQFDLDQGEITGPHQSERARTPKGRTTR